MKYHLQTICYVTYLCVVEMCSAMDFHLPGDAMFNPSILVDHRFVSNLQHDDGKLLSRHRRYIYTEPDTVLVRQFENHLTAREGEESPALQDIVNGLIHECDGLSKKALNESIAKYADHNYMVHYNHTEMVYRYYRHRYQDFTESLYHKLIYIMPHLVKKHMRTVFMNVTADLKIVDTACMNRFQELDDRVNTHFLSYGELFRSILIESYTDIEKNFYSIFTDKPQFTVDGQGIS